MRQTLTACTAVVTDKITTTATGSQSRGARKGSQSSELDENEKSVFLYFVIHINCLQSVIFSWKGSAKVPFSVSSNFWDTWEVSTKTLRPQTTTTNQYETRSAVVRNRTCDHGLNDVALFRFARSLSDSFEAFQLVYQKKELDIVV